MARLNSTGSLSRGAALTAPLAGLRSTLAALGGETALVLALLLIAVLAHAVNMFNNPGLSAFGDEGIYVSQAWAVLRQGQLAPYTYFYDHAPAGWILIAGWMALTGGPFAFGHALDGGRVFMLVLQVASALMLYRVARKLGCGAPAAAFATLLFSLSPLAIYFHRPVLLDNVMVFWLLLSLDLLLDGWGRLSRVVLSGICFGMAVLSKETAFFLLPAMLVIAWQQRWEHQGRFAILGWLLPMASIISLYPLYALLKSELLPAGSALAFYVFNIDTGQRHVSLVEALTWQATRGGGGMLNLDNQFWRLARGDWMPRDPVLFAGGAIATGINLLRGIRDRRALVAGLLGVLPLFYLARGGVVLVFYVLAVLPFFALNLAMLINPLLTRLPLAVASLAVALATAGLLGFYWQAGTIQPLYTGRQGIVAREAVSWIKQNLPPESRMVIEDAPWTDLHEPGLGGPAFPNAHNHWKVALDPEIRDGVFKNDWRTVDYVLMLPGLRGILQETKNTVALGALEHGHVVKRWESDGEIMELWKVDQPGSTERALLQSSNAYIQKRFARDGAFVDSSGVVTSEAQSYALLRAVWMNDRRTFDRTWQWTRKNMLDQEGLLAWHWQSGTISDPHTAADADTDTALALLMAGRRWNDPQLLAAGTSMVQAIWEREVVIIAGKPYLAAGDWATRKEIVPLNPSYFAPYAYRIFQEVDHEHNWLALVDTSYQVIFESSSAPLGAPRSAGLPPDWIGIERTTGKLVPIQIDGRDTTLYGYDAARTFWRVALDHSWSGDGRAQTYLNQAGFLRDEAQRKGGVSAVYAHSGDVIEIAPSAVSDAGALAVLIQNDPALASKLYAARYIADLQRDGVHTFWDNPTDLYTQEWAWFATALYADALPDLWHP